MIFALHTQPAIYICENNNNWTGRKSISNLHTFFSAEVVTQNVVTIIH